MGLGVPDAQYFEVASYVLCIKAAWIWQILEANAGYFQECRGRCTLLRLKMKKRVRTKNKFLRSWDFLRVFANSRTRS
jgi:hypothetical protein